jgi:hypothetical protein
VGPRDGLDDLEKIKFLTLPGLELLPLCRPARSQSLYRLRYLGSFTTAVEKLKVPNSRITQFCRYNYCMGRGGNVIIKYNRVEPWQYNHYS